MNTTQPTERLTPGAPPPQPSAVTRIQPSTGTQMAMAGLGDEFKLTAEEISNIFATVARACATREEKWLYLAKCKADGLSPLRQELYPVRRTANEPLIFVTSYHVFVSRVRQMGWVVRSAAVCANDKWGGWDAVKGLPILHQIFDTNRGAILGAWCSLLHTASGAVVGQYFSLAEMNTGGPTWRAMPATMAAKTAVCRVARSVCPSLTSLYGAAELGVEPPPTEEHQASDGSSLADPGTERPTIDVSAQEPPPAHEESQLPPTAPEDESQLPATAPLPDFSAPPLSSDKAEKPKPATQRVDLTNESPERRDLLERLANFSKNPAAKTDTLYAQAIEENGVARVGELPTEVLRWLVGQVSKQMRGR